MPNHFFVLGEADAVCSVIDEETGAPVTLAGIPQTGLDHEIAEELAEKLSRMAQRIEEAQSNSPQAPGRN